MELLVALLPAAACAALMLVCFRMMRHPEMHGESGANEEIVALRAEGGISARRARADALFRRWRCVRAGP